MTTKKAQAAKQTAKSESGDLNKADDKIEKALNLNQAEPAKKQAPIIDAQQGEVLAQRVDDAQATISKKAEMVKADKELTEIVGPADKPIEFLYDDPGAITEYCEALCDAVHEVSALQARVLRATYRDQLNPMELSRSTGLPPVRNSAELMAAHNTLVQLITEGAFSEWHDAHVAITPDDDGPAPAA